MSNLADNKLYKVWYSMKYRCYNPKSNSFKYYGARGISVCNEWFNDFRAFELWAFSNGYAEGLSIDRIDVNGNYCPENCRWSTKIEQCNNMRRNILITYLGKTQTLAQWARELGRQYESLKDSYRRGTFPPTEENAHRRRNQPINYQGKSLTLKQWAEELGVDYCTLKQKRQRGTFPPTEENAYRRRNKLITYNGFSLTMRQWSEKLGIPYSTIKKRVAKGIFPPTNEDKED